MASACSSAHHGGPINQRRVSAWFPYSPEQGVAPLQPHIDLIASLSVFRSPPSRDFFDCCRDRGINTLRLVGGEGTAFDTPQRARARVEQYVRDCREVGYGGIDLDFEHFGGEYRERYSAFMRQAAAALHDIGRRLSICVPGFPLYAHRTPPDSHFCDPEVIGDVCDEVRVMCYDMIFAPHGWVGPTSTCPWARDVMLFWLQYVPRDKLIMGLPAYGNDFPLPPGSGNGAQVHWETPADAPGAHDAEKNWLRYERINVYRYMNAHDQPHMLYATDFDSTRGHLETVDELGLPAISFWHYGTIAPGVWRAVYDWLGQ